MRFMVVVLWFGDSGTSGLAWVELKHLVGFGLLKDNKPISSGRNQAFAFQHPSINEM